MRNVAALSGVPVEPASCILDLGVHPPPFKIHRASGSYVPDLEASPGGTGGDGVGPSSEEPFCVLVPLCGDGPAGGCIDWPMLRWGLGIFREGQLPLLQRGVQPAPESLAGSPRDDGGVWHYHVHDGEDALRIKASELLVDAWEPSQLARKRPRRRMYTVTISGQRPPPQPPASEAVVEVRQALHRSYLKDGANVSPLVQDEAATTSCETRLQLDCTACNVMPLTRSVHVGLLAVPALLWCLEVCGCVEELRHELLALTPPVRVDGRLLRIAMTHSGLGFLSVELGAEEPGDQPWHIQDARRLAGSDCERLEFFGDALLKYCGSLVALLEEPTATEGRLHELVKCRVCNSALREVGDRLRLVRRLIIRSFNRHDRLSTLRDQKVPWKAAADAVEALVAAMWLSQKDHTEQLTSLVSFYQAHVQRKEAALHDWRRSLKEQITYRGISEKLNFERLEFFGDAALQAMVSEYLVKLLPHAKEGDLTFARSMLVCNSYLARRALGHLASTDEDGGEFGSDVRRHRDMLSCSQSLPPGSTPESLCSCEGRMAELRQIAWEISQPDAPKTLPKQLADLYETIVGQACLRAAGDLESVWGLIMKDFQVDAQEMVAILVDLRRTDVGAQEDEVLEWQHVPSAGLAACVADFEVVD